MVGGWNSGQVTPLRHRQECRCHPEIEIKPYALAELREYARPTFTPGRPLLGALEELTCRIHDEFKYQPKSTSIDTPLVEILHNRRGVCQDFAHLLIGALRSLRLSARYVSGNIRSGPRFQGAAASHAWVSALDPEKG